MDDSANKKAETEASASVSNKNEHSKELNKLIDLLNSVDWEMRINIIQRNSGLPFGDGLIDASTTLDESSVAGSFGNKTIGEFITNGPDKAGLGMEWADWNDLVTAKIYKNQFNIASGDHVDILDQVSDVKKYINRNPSTPEEFYSVRQQMLHKQFTEKLYISEQEIRKLNNKIKVSEDKFKSVVIELEELKITKNEDLKSLAEELEMEHEISVEKLTAEMNTKHSNELNAIKKKFGSTIASQKSKMQQDLTSFNSREEQAREQFSDIESKMTKQLDDLSRQLESEKMINQDRINAIYTLEKDNKDLSIEVDTKRSDLVSSSMRESKLKEKLDEVNLNLSGRLRVANDALDREKVETQRLSDEILKLGETVSELEETVLKSKSEKDNTNEYANSVRKKYDDERAKNNKLNDALSAIHEEHEKLIDEYKNLESDCLNAQEKEDNIRLTLSETKEKMSAKLSSLSLANSKLSDSLSEKTEQFESLSIEHKSLKNEKNLLQGKEENGRIQLSELKDKLNNQVKALTAKNEELVQANAVLADDVDHFNSELESLRSEHSAVLQKEESIRSQYLETKEKFSNQIKDLNKKLETSQSANDVKKGTIFNLNEKIKELHIDLEAKESDVSVLQNREEQSRKQFAGVEEKLSNKIKDINKALEFEQSNNESRTNKIFTLNERIKDLNLEIDKKKSEIAINLGREEKYKKQSEETKKRLLDNIDNFAKSVEDEKVIVASKENEISILKDKLDTLASTLDRKEKDLAKKSAEVDQNDRIVAGLKSDHDRLLSEEKIHHKAKLKNLSEELSATAAKYSSLKKSYNDIKKRFDAQVLSHKKTRVQLDKALQNTMKSASDWEGDRKKYINLIKLGGVVAAALVVTNLIVASTI